MKIIKQIFAGKHGDLELSLKTTDKGGFAHSRVSDRLKWIDKVLTTAQEDIKTVLQSTGDPLLQSDWKDAIVDAGIVNWTLTKEHMKNPRMALAALLAHVEVLALDSAVSKPAAQWKAREETLKQLLREAVVSVEGMSWSGNQAWMALVDDALHDRLPTEGVCENTDCSWTDVPITMHGGRPMCALCKSYNVTVSEKKETTT